MTHRILLGIVVGLVIGAVGVVGLLWSPAPAPSAGVDPSVQTSTVLDATLLDVQPAPGAGTELLAPGAAAVNITARLDETGQTITFEAVDDTGDTYRAGQRVVISVIETEGLQTTYVISDFQRNQPLLLLGALFVLAVVGFGRLQGLRALLGLTITGVLIVAFVIPAILAGQDPVVVALAAAVAIMIVTLYLSHGFSPKTTAAVVGTALALLLTGALAALFVELASITGFSSEDARVANAALGGLSLQGLLLAGIIIGGLGVLDDVTVSQSSTVFEIAKANPKASFGTLFASALNVGRDHVAATVNTLFLAYAGASLPLLILFATGDGSILSTLTSEVVAVEVIRTLVGSIGLIAAVPFTTALAAALALDRTEVMALPGHAAAEVEARTRRSAPREGRPPAPDVPGSTRRPRGEQVPRAPDSPEDWLPAAEPAAGGRRSGPAAGAHRSGSDAGASPVASGHEDEPFAGRRRAQLRAVPEPPVPPVSPASTQEPDDRRRRAPAARTPLPRGGTGDATVPPPAKIRRYGVDSGELPRLRRPDIEADRVARRAQVEAEDSSPTLLRPVPQESHEPVQAPISRSRRSVERYESQARERGGEPGAVPRSRSAGISTQTPPPREAPTREDLSGAPPRRSRVGSGGGPGSGGSDRGGRGNGHGNGNGNGAAAGSTSLGSWRDRAASPPSPREDGTRRLPAPPRGPDPDGPRGDELDRSGARRGWQAPPTVPVDDDWSPAASGGNGPRRTWASPPQERDEEASWPPPSTLQPDAAAPELPRRRRQAAQDPAEVADRRPPAAPERRRRPPAGSRQPPAAEPRPVADDGYGSLPGDGYQDRTEAVPDLPRPQRRAEPPPPPARTPPPPVRTPQPEARRAAPPPTDDEDAPSTTRRDRRGKRGRRDAEAERKAPAPPAKPKRRLRGRNRPAPKTAADAEQEQLEAWFQQLRNPYGRRESTDDDPDSWS